MKKTTLLFAIILLAAAGVKAQTYETAVGAKFYTGNGSLGGINIRHSTSEHTALEGSLLFFSGGLGIEGLYQYQGPIAGAEGLQYFVGGGGMLGFGTESHNSETFLLYALQEVWIISLQMRLLVLVLALILFFILRRLRVLTLLWVLG